jgi:hypothetical protein
VDNVWLVSAVWLGLALAASLISIWVGISVALIEIMVGALAGNTIGLARLLSDRHKSSDDAWCRRAESRLEVSASSQAVVIRHSAAGLPADPARCRQPSSPVPVPFSRVPPLPLMSCVRSRPASLRVEHQSDRHQADGGRSQVVAPFDKLLLRARVGCLCPRGERTGRRVALTPAAWQRHKRLTNSSAHARRSGRLSMRSQMPPTNVGRRFCFSPPAPCTVGAPPASPPAAARRSPDRRR